MAASQKRYPIENNKANESSGLACSTRDKHVLWTHNDSGHMPIIYAMDNKGKDLASFHLEANAMGEMEAIDWEDMDAFKLHGKSYLLIADTGDNFRLRFNYQIYIIKEPDLKNSLNSFNSFKTNGQSCLSPAWSFSFQFENGESYDVESAAVDILREKILILSKRSAHAFLFELPLKPADPEKLQTAIKTAEFKDIIKPSALDISADGKIMSINTYARIHRFKRVSSKQSNNWVYDYSLSYKKLFQPEAMCLAKNRKNYYVTSEKKPYLLKIKIKP